MAGLIPAVLPALVAAPLWSIWFAVLIATGLLMAIDAVLGVSRRRMTAAHTAPDMLYISDVDTLSIELDAGSLRYAPIIEVRVEVSETLALIPTQRVRLGHPGRGTLSFDLRPTRRGTAEVHAVWLRWAGPLRLMRRTLRVPVGASISVVPNIRAVREAAVRFANTQEFIAGAKVQQFVGDGSEFDALREYMPGLDHRAIDWKASARHLKLLVREFRAERNNQVYLAFDTGHLMSEPLDGVPKLDHAINAGLMLAYVCLKSGDQVGVYGFGERVELFAKAQRGLQTMERIQQHTAALEYGTSETNFTLGLTELLVRLRRRSLIIVFTDFVDTVTAELMLDNMSRLSRRHLVLFVSFRDGQLEALAASPPQTLVKLHQSVVAAGFEDERETVLLQLARLGVLNVEARVGEVTSRLINRYLEIKRREMV